METNEIKNSKIFMNTSWNLTIIYIKQTFILIVKQL